MPYDLRQLTNYTSFMQTSAADMQAVEGQPHITINESPLKLKFRQHPAIHTNYSLLNCTISK